MFQEIRPGSGFETVISLKKSWGGYRRRTNSLYTLGATMHGIVYRVNECYDRGSPFRLKIVHE